MNSNRSEAINFVQAFLEEAESDTAIATAGGGRGPGGSTGVGPSRTAPHAVRSTGVTASLGDHYKTLKINVNESMLTLLCKLHEKLSPVKSVYKPHSSDLHGGMLRLTKQKLFQTVL